MCAWRRSAVWPQVVAISLIGLGAASCTDSGRFSDMFGSDTPARTDTTGSIPARPAPDHVVSRPLPPVASADPQGISGGGRGMGSYQPAGPEITGSVRPSPPPPSWNWNGGTAVTVARGETLDMIARKHGVPVSVIMAANHITNPAEVHAGQHLVIPRYHAAPMAYAPPATRVAVPGAPAGSPRTALAPTPGVHVVAPGETLNSIARLYGTSPMALAKANNIPPYTMVRVGQRISVPDTGARAHAEVAPPPARQDVANLQSPHSAYNANPAPQPVQETPAKAADPVGAIPSFRWPARGHIIAAFGHSLNGTDDDGIDVAVPEGTPIKAADDGVVAYAGNELQGYGNLVLIRHSNGYVTAYAHASEILVKRGETVKRGQVIAKSGSTGNVKSPELHFEVRRGATPVDPQQFLGGV
jgi:murein DD-endopeptidase MepM/ murein hydrolase activator NlpD